jgi:hypothetical protein
MMQHTASQRDEQARQAWRGDIAANFNTRDQFAFVDESSEDGHTLYRRFGRASSPVGKRPTERKDDSA